MISEDQHEDPACELVRTISNNTSDISEVCIVVRNLDEGTVDRLDSDSIPTSSVVSVSATHKIWQDYWQDRQSLKQSLFRAVMTASCGELRQLLEKKDLDLNEYQFMNGWTLLHHAANNKSPQVVKMLVERGSFINACTHSMKYTPLMLAVLQKNSENAHLLLKLGADPNIPDSDGFTCMHYIVQYGYLELLEIFLSCSTLRLDLPNNRGMTVLDCCRCMKMKNTIRQYMKISPHEITTRFYLTRVVPLSKDRSIVLRTRSDYVDSILSGNEPLEREQESGSFHTKSVVKRGKENFYLGKKLNPAKLIRATTMADQSLLNFQNSLVEQEQGEPETLECYDLLKVLGKGSFGQVYLGRRKQSSILVALKRLKKKDVIDKKLKRYVMAERAVLKNIKSPFVVHGHSFFQDSHYLYMVMEFCPGGDMERLIQRQKISEELARDYCCEIVLALEELHSKKYLFRDLKPANVLIDAEGHLKLSDFGLAKQSELSGSFLGSFAYLAPEMLVATDNKPHSATMDWYLLGVFVYEMLMGYPPYFNQNKVIMMDQIKNSKPRLPTKVSSECRDFLERSLMKNPDKRLGNKGSEEVKAHSWFAGVDWSKVKKRELELPKPSINWSQLRQREYIGEQGCDEEEGEQTISGWEFCEGVGQKNKG